MDGKLNKTRKAIEERERAKEEAERLEKYEAFLAQMIFELSEFTALVFYPWVFKDEQGRHRDKYQCPPYLELVNTLFKQNYDVLEEMRIQLTEEIIEKMFVESNEEITKAIVAGVHFFELKKISKFMQSCILMERLLSESTSK